MNDREFPTLGSAAKQSLARFIDPGSQDVLIAVDGSGRDPVYAAVFVYNLNEEGVVRIQEVRYGPTPDDAALALVAAQDAHNELSRAHAAELHAGARTKDDLRASITNADAAYREHFVPMSEAVQEARVAFQTTDRAIVLAEDELAGPTSESRFCAIALEPRASDLNEVLIARTAPTMDEAIVRLIASLRE